MLPLLPTTLNDEPVAVNVTAAPDLTPIVICLDNPVKFAPLIAGSVPVKFAAGNEVKFAPDPTKLVAVITPVELAFVKTKVAALLTVTDVPLPIGDILSTLTMLISFY